MDPMPEIFSNLLPRVLERMKKISTQDYPRHVIDYLGPPNGACHLTLTRPLSTTRTWREVLGTVTYVITLENSVFSSWGMVNPLCRIVVLHTRDAYFSVGVLDYAFFYLFGRTLSIGIHFVGEAYGSRCLSPCFDVSAYNRERGEALPFSPQDLRCSYGNVGHSRVHFSGGFEITRKQLERAGFLRHGRVELKIQLSRKQNTRVSHLAS